MLTFYAYPESTPKGLYARAEAGEIPHFTGVSSPYEPPTTPEVVIHTDTDPVDACVDHIIDALDDRGFLPVSD